jgi:hypothetical protein
MIGTFSYGTATMVGTIDPQPLLPNSRRGAKGKTWIFRSAATQKTKRAQKPLPDPGVTKNLPP